MCCLLPSCISGLCMLGIASGKETLRSKTVELVNPRLHSHHHRHCA